ncbi:ATP-binding protein, partial [Candidatus Parcubacteria bacterium]
RVDVDDAPEGQEGETGYIRTKEGRLPIDHFGDGARHAFKVLAGLIALCEVVDKEHPGLFLWEDPELFMHPESLNRLLRTIMQLIKHKPIQVFCSSQSLEVVALFTHYFAKDKSALQDDLRNKLRAFRLDLEDGRLYAAVFHFANLRTWLEQGMDPRHWGVVDLPLTHFYREDTEATAEEDL